ncbi:39S ribosomal protein L44, mitochondrial-like [Actinia tenebrosa]|uniref:Large ribosomal subunit protein mL44 n=1 Tax=Actinia tenebrosa TaxID=6105 RepID=A0A6P8HHX2_ACTTE|nr:39S ribosomal protein L44, mitochondrial-like [Actinia tenebrosa]
MAAHSQVLSCLRLLQRSCTIWGSRSPDFIGNRAIILSGATCRFYRGSNRDTRRRERNERARQRKREGIKPKVFDKREFININYDKELFAFKSRLSLQSIDDSVLKQALTHESYQEDPQLADQNNSKLSILGYNLTAHHITEFLCFKYPSLNVEGIRCLIDFLTSRESIVKIAQLTALPELIKTEFDLDMLHQEKHLNYVKEDVICDAFYALIGAIYSDKGSHEANKFIQDFIITQLQGQELSNLLTFKDPENLLKDILLAEGKPKPEARVIRESGKRTHLPVFVVGIFSGDTMLGEAASYNITKAKNQATLASLMKLFERDMKLDPSLPSEKEEIKFQVHERS